MIVVVLLWVLIFFNFFVLGFSVVRVLNRILRQKGNSNFVKPDEFFFFGFLTLSAFTGFISIFIPVGSIVLCCLNLLTLFLFWINFSEIKLISKEVLKAIPSLSKAELLFLIMIIIFILTAVTQKITTGDTESYHAQSIQWVRKYAVVPGLGNIHGRLAFNSMFFVISGLFSFQIKDILIFPLNGICYTVLVIKLFLLYKNENAPGTRWKAVFYLLTLLISLLIVIPDLNSPAPDIICGTLIIYCFILLMNYVGKGDQESLIQIILLNLVVFSCVAFKISSLFLVVAIIFLLDKDHIRRSMLSILIGIIVISPFIIRNYYLSGYLIYPFPTIDIFNVDWKIPYENVLNEKVWIEAWAKISTLPALDVVHMKISEWIIPWFKSLNFSNRMIVSINALNVFSIILLLVKRDFFLAKIQFVILINLIFWFLMAPDTRFAYGFLFIGFSLNFACLLKFLEGSSFSGIFKYVRIVLACILFLIVFKRIMFPLDTLRNPLRWIIPASFGTVETNDFYSGFHYRVPVPEGGCFNVEIPCVPYPLSNIVLRGESIQDGFKVVKQQVPIP
jgi:hypothetical protein